MVASAKCSGGLKRRFMLNYCENFPPVGIPVAAVGKPAGSAPGHISLPFPARWAALRRP